MTIDPRTALKVIQEHFRTVTPEEFRANVKRFSPDDVPPLRPDYEEMQRSDDGPATPRTLQAYLASALTHLDGGQNEALLSLSDAISASCRRNGVDVYQPRTETDPSHHRHLSAAEVYHRNRNHVLASDVIIVLCQYPSFGAGLELGIAHEALVPAVVLCDQQTHMSRMVSGLPGMHVSITFHSIDDLAAQMDAQLHAWLPMLQARRRDLDRYRARTLWRRIAARREQLQLSHDQIVATTPWLTRELLQEWESATEQTVNPSYLQLCQLADVLQLPVTDLVR